LTALQRALLVYAVRASGPVSGIPSPVRVIVARKGKAHFLQPSTGLEAEGPGFRVAVASELAAAAKKKPLFRWILYAGACRQNVMQGDFFSRLSYFAQPGVTLSIHRVEFPGSPESLQVHTALRDDEKNLLRALGRPILRGPGTKLLGCVPTRRQNNRKDIRYIAAYLYLVLGERLSHPVRAEIIRHIFPNDKGDCALKIIEPVKGTPLETYRQGKSVPRFLCNKERSVWLPWTRTEKSDRPSILQTIQHTIREVSDRLQRANPKTKA
jgi:hypothetical protein